MESERKMVVKDKFVCKKCNMNCKLTASIAMEEDFPHACPFGVLPSGGYENEPKWVRKEQK